MMKTDVVVLDVDAIARKEFSGTNLDFGETPACFEIEPYTGNRRWRPALLLGEYAAEFVPAFFRWPAHVPWSGFVTARDSVVLESGLTMAAQSVLVGDSISVPADSFPQASFGQVVTPMAGGSFSVQVPPEAGQLMGLCCQLVSPEPDDYRHWMIDILPRLHKALRLGIDIDHYLFAGKANAWKGQLLEAAGHASHGDIYMGERQMGIKAERMVMPTFDRRGSEIRPSLLDVHKLILSRHASEQLSAPAAKRLYLEAPQDGGSPENAAEIRKAFEQEGFETLSPDLSFADRVRVLAQASSVVGYATSSLLDTVYCRPKTRIGAIQPADSRDFLQAQMAMFSQHDIFYLIGTPQGNAQGWSVDPFQARRLVKLLVS